MTKPQKIEGGKKYQIIYADPPWDLGKGGDGHWNLKNGETRLKYPTMTVEEIKSLPVKNISDKNSWLFLWVINKYILQAYEICREWGFKPSVLLTWCKPKHGIGIGGTFVQTTEHLLFARRGTKKANHRIDTTWFNQPRLTHSTKPEFFRKLIDELGDGNKIELFARQKTEGWDTWGNEVTNDIEL